MIETIFTLKRKEIPSSQLNNAKMIFNRKSEEKRRLTMMASRWAGRVEKEEGVPSIVLQSLLVDKRCCSGGASKSSKILSKRWR